MKKVVCWVALVAACAFCVSDELENLAAKDLSDQVAANARFAQSAVKAIRKVQDDLHNMKKTEASEISDMSQVGQQVNGIPDHQPGQFAAEEAKLGQAAANIEQRAAASVQDEDRQQTLAVDALHRANILIESFDTAGVNKKANLGASPENKAFGVSENKQVFGLGETGPQEDLARQYRAAKQAVGKLKEVSATLARDTKTSNTKALIKQMQSEATTLQQEATQSPSLGESPEKLGAALQRMDADEAKLRTDASQANFKVSAPAAHSKLLQKETQQLSQLVAQEKQVTQNEQADQKEVQSLWDKLN